MGLVKEGAVMQQLWRMSLSEYVAQDGEIRFDSYFKLFLLALTITLILSTTK